MRKVAIFMVLTSALAGCAKEETPISGVYVEISLKNDADIDKYVVFNPKLRTIEECEATFEQALPQVMANLPEAIPKNSVATGWKCSIEDPSKITESGKK